MSSKQPGRLEKVIRLMSDKGRTVASASVLPYRTLVSADDSDGLLLELTALLRREIAIEELLQRLVERMRRALDADRGTLYLLDGGRRELVSKAADLPELPEIRLGWGQGIAGQAASAGAVVNVPTSVKDARFFAEVDEQTGYRTTSILAAPVRNDGGAIVGVVQLLNARRGYFDAEDETRIAALAAQAGRIIGATTLHSELTDASNGPRRSPPTLPCFLRMVNFIASSVGRNPCDISADSRCGLLRLKRTCFFAASPERAKNFLLARFTSILRARAVLSSRWTVPRCLKL